MGTESSAEQEIKETYYRFDQHFFFKNSRNGAQNAKSQVPYFHEQKTMLPASILIKDGIGKRIKY